MHMGVDNLLFTTDSQREEIWIGLWRTDLSNTCAECWAISNRHNWVWRSSQETVDYRNWGTQAPSGQAQCAYMGRPGLWRDADCEDAFSFVCEIDTAGV